MSENRIKRSFINRSKMTEDQISEAKERKGEELCKEFVWRDELEEEVGDNSPVQFSSDEITHCCQEVTAYVIKEISVGTLRDVNMGRMYFEISLSCDFHPLFLERFNSAWSLDSRLEMMDQLRSELSSNFDEDTYRIELNQRIQKVIPDSRRSCSFNSVLLNDDTVIMQNDDSPFSVEISLQFDAIQEECDC